jgi:hypothetical protein
MDWKSNWKKKKKQAVGYLPQEDKKGRKKES